MLTTLRDSARYVGLDPAATEAMTDLDRRIREGARVAPDDVPCRRLLDALAEVPAARERHARRGIEPEVTRATLADLALWCRHHQEHTGRAGLSEDAFTWTRQYLRGDLLRIGQYQFVPRPFDATLIAVRHRETGRVVTLALPVRREAGALTARPFDNATGAACDEAVTLDARAWEVVLAPGDPTLELHIPADAHLQLAGLVSDIRDACAYLTRRGLSPPPRGVWGEAWLLDPQARVLLPDHAGVRDLQRACHLFPSALPEAHTIRRFFGPDVARASLAALPRAGMNPFQRRLADFLASPDRSLRARGAYVTCDELDALARGEFSR